MDTARWAEIGAIADGLEMYRARVAGLAEPLVATPNEDLLAALYETERALRTAHRAMRRAAGLAR